MNSVSHTMPLSPLDAMAATKPQHLMAYLAKEFEDHWRAENRWPMNELAGASWPLFVDFCESYLRKVRPHSAYFVEGNVGVVMANSDRVLLAPVDAPLAAGQTLPADAIPVI